MTSCLEQYALMVREPASDEALSEAASGSRRAAMNCHGASRSPKVSG